jgi:hypothetical protein
MTIKQLLTNTLKESGDSLSDITHSNRDAKFITTDMKYLDLIDVYATLFWSNRYIYYMECPVTDVSINDLEILFVPYNTPDKHPIRFG